MPNDNIEIGDLQNADDLKAILGAMQARISDLEGKVTALKQSRPMLVDRLDALEGELDDINGHVELVDASIDTARKGKIENIHAVLEHASERGSRGMHGTTLKTGEVHAVISGSRNTALRLIDEIGGAFEWAKTENPGGQKQKRLKLDLRQPVETMKADVTAHYGGNQEEATG